MRISKSKNNPIAVTMGDPGGIGPEIVAKAIKSRELDRNVQLLLIGDKSIFAHYLKKIPSFCTLIDCPNPTPAAFQLGKINYANGAAALTYLEVAIELVKNNIAGAMVTAPLAKAAVQLTYKKFYGHTEYLAQAFGVKHVDMMFVAEELRTVIATRHIPVNRISHDLTQSAIMETAQLTNQALKNIFKIKSPTLAVCGLNPHAGESGSIGNEEIQTIIPAIKKLKAKRINVNGPYAADTLFSLTTGKKYDAVIAMYHDQGLIPVKTLTMDKLVNLTIGLPFIRTSPAHGTAFDIVGKNTANPSSMIAAINLAARLSS